MDNITLAGLLAATPPADLKIIELTAELTLPRRRAGPGRGGGPAVRRGTGLRPGRGLRRRHQAAAGSDAVATAAPPLLSGLARAAPAASAVAAGAGDPGWLRGGLCLVRRAGAAPFSPGSRRDSGRPRREPEASESFAGLFQERHFPLYGPFLDFWLDEGDEPPWSMAPPGNPLRPDGLRVRRPARDVGRVPGGSLGPGPAGRTARLLLHGTRRDKDGLAGVGRRAHPPGDAGPHSIRAAYPLRP